MNKTKIKPSTDEGWAIHVYDRDRHLRLTLEPSHIWAFGWGIGVGLLIAIVWSVFYSSSQRLASNADSTTNLLPISETNYESDLDVEATRVIPLGID